MRKPEGPAAVDFFSHCLSFVKKSLVFNVLLTNT